MNRALSTYLDLVRFSAAAIVFIVHANYDRFTGGLPIVWRLADLGNDAVMIFFVLSGFVISYVTTEREKNPATYCAARLSRLWSVGIPALLLTILLDSIGSRLAPSMYDGWWYQTDYPIARFIINLLFVNEIWFISIRPFSNGPYWSIGYEFWYYAIFGAAIFTHGKVRILVLSILLAIAGPKIILLLPVWLMGVWAQQTRILKRVSLNTAAIIFASSILAYAGFRYIDAPQAMDDFVKSTLGNEFVIAKLQWSQHFLSSYVIGFLISVNFIATRTLFSKIPESRIPFESAIRYAAGFTFSLYLLHYPLLQFFSAAMLFVNPNGQNASLVVIGTLLSVWLIGSWIERQKAPLKDWLLALTTRPLGRKSI